MTGKSRERVAVPVRRSRWAFRCKASSKAASLSWFSLSASSLAACSTACDRPSAFVGPC